jgi:hypothetical protein
MPAPVEQELQAASAKCREALNAKGFAGLDALPGAPRDAEGWFELLSQYDWNPRSVGALNEMKAALPAEPAGARLERYAVLQALSVAALRIVSEPVPSTVKRFYATRCAEIAEGERQWDSHFDMKGDPERFLDVAECATLRRFPAGALDFSYGKLSLLRTMLSIHPHSAPGYLYKRLVSLPYTKLAIAPHINYGRKGSLVLMRADYERALWLIAKAVEMDARVKGINGSSWFYSQTVGEFYPHLAWMRAVYVDGGAYLIDTFPAQPGGYGFAYNSRKRQILYDEGKFCPRETAFFWSRDDFLDWASRHPELVPEGEEPIRAPRRRRAIINIRSPKPAKPAKSNSSKTLWNGKAALDRMGRSYVGLVLLLPAFLLSLVVFLVSGIWLALLAFPVGVYLAFSFQYAYSQ